MDRRQRKTREAIFDAFCSLMSSKHYSQITVGQIIEKANVGRATFYAHFETKDFLLKELCGELFCHIFDGIDGDNMDHKHIFECNAPSSVFLHLLMHVQNNDRNLLDLLASENNEIFIRYFKENLRNLIKNQLHIFEGRIPTDVPTDFRVNHICSTFVETVRWWTENGMKESPEKLSEYFLAVI